jgi:hypothetical protein
MEKTVFTKSQSIQRSAPFSPAVCPRREVPTRQAAVTEHGSERTARQPDIDGDPVGRRDACSESSPETRTNGRRTADKAVTDRRENYGAICDRLL